ncbi:SsrA-binding protein SmpB [Candidatus Pacebacteria bacterium]|nr:SsrA-binding protein SmpB [Candidatus Paceibacterota bacterium]
MANLISNKKARFDFEILETFEAGLVLAGYEVKSIKLGRAKLNGAHILIRGGEAFLVNASVAPYQSANMPKDYDPEHPRKLLLSKKELKKLETESEQVGLTIVPIRLYNAGRKLKLEIAIARGKQKADKRQSMKKRDAKRDIERQLKTQE